MVIQNDIFGLEICRVYPKHSTRYALKKFGKKPITIVEIGLNKGINAKDLFKRLNIKKAYLIDPYEEYKEYEGQFNPGTLLPTKEEALEKLKKYKDKYLFLEDYSGKIINKIPMVDFVYIDGNHSKEYAYEDMCLYWEKVKKGGLLTGDMQTTMHTGVPRALIRFCYERNLDPIITRSDFIIYKK